MINKKRYTFSFDEKMIDDLNAFLKPKGISLSGYLNSMIKENMVAIEALQGVDSLKDLTIGKLTQLFSGMVDDINKEKKGKKK
jgi:hypothetical protein